MRVTAAEIEEDATLEMGQTGYVLTLQTGLVSPMVQAILARALARI
ncbi:MAG: hypothetical protein M3P23_09545 [Actinomycetota bacterium]|nr:hypothetical protein [Actinomycetota bacterium]